MSLTPSNQPKLEQQRRQWQLALQDQLGSDFGANEVRIEALGGRTLELSSDEWYALEAASRSLSTPPPPMSVEKRIALLRVRFPVLYEALASEAEPGSETARQNAKVIRPYLNYIRPGPKSALDLERASRNLSAIAYVFGDFAIFLRIFSVDSERFAERPYDSNSRRDMDLVDIVAKGLRNIQAELPRTEERPWSQAVCLRLISLILVLRGQGSLNTKTLNFGNSVNDDAPAALRSALLGGLKLAPGTSAIATTPLGKFFSKFIEHISYGIDDDLLMEHIFENAQLMVENVDSVRLGQATEQFFSELREFFSDKRRRKETELVPSDLFDPRGQMMTEHPVFQLQMTRLFSTIGERWPPVLQIPEVALLLK